MYSVNFLPQHPNRNGKSCHYNRHHGHQLDKDIQGWSGGILEGISNGVSHHSGFVGISSLAPLLLDHFLGIVPGASGVGLEDRHQHAGCGDTGQQGGSERVQLRCTELLRMLEPGEWAAYAL